ncbi:MAG: hypothetical protein ABR67_01035 [Acidimicrobium sp. BACL17 MAG-120823-bin42]|jgi:hypothetical protein|nr:MAG: hypothetical protein ABR57_07690 [Acidimicrobium sp. BACL17 MAG-120924-bin0]KRO43792.1 MAG: hypothetical protein ABR67_01035 [Acidimicrobium sp. BACL17 MAG-120823-bin42]
MSKRIDIELTSNRGDGTWTWRAAGAKTPKGALNGAILDAGAKVGDTVKVEAEFDLDGVDILSVVKVKEKSYRGNLLEIIGSNKEFQPVTQKLAEKGKDRKPRKDGDRKPRRDGDKRPPREGADAEKSGDRRPRRPSFTAPPELPKRPAAKRLKPRRTHRSAVLDTLPVEQRGVAERALIGGIKAVRDAVKEQNDALKKEGKPEIPAEGLISMAQELLPKLRVAEWLDKAEAAKADILTLDLRDLRQVVVGADDPMVVRDETTRALATELKAALKSRQETEQIQWLEDIKSAIAVSRVIRALKMSSEPPKAGQPFPAELGAQLAAAASTAISSETAPDRFCAVLEAIAFSPVRGQVKLATVPANPNETVLATVKRVAPLVPQIAALFGVVVAPGVSSPRPLRPTRPTRPKAKPAPKAPSTSTEG